MWCNSPVIKRKLSRDHNKSAVGFVVKTGMSLDMIIRLLTNICTKIRRNYQTREDHESLIKNLVFADVRRYNLLRLREESQ